MLVGSVLGSDCVPMNDLESLFALVGPPRRFDRGRLPFACSPSLAIVYDDLLRCAGALGESQGGLRDRTLNPRSLPL